jgi:hypothetical protein
MKTCILSRARTRSSVFCSSIQNHYQCRNFGELYFYHKKILENTAPNFEENTKNTTNKIFSYNDFVIKLWPKYLIYTENKNVPTSLSDLHIIKNLESTFLLSQYDKIYYVTRNIADCICSYYFALYAQKWSFTNKNDIEKLQNKKMNFSFYGSSKWVNFYLYEVLLQEQMKKYLENKQIPFTIVDYNDIPYYCSKNYSDPKNDLRIDTEFNYKEIFTNYPEVENYVVDYLQNNNIIIDFV